MKSLLQILTEAEKRGVEWWRMTKDDFIKYHYTGHIESSAYSGKREYTVERLKEFIKYDRYKILIDKINIGGMELELRQTGEKLKYYKWDEENFRYYRDKEGNLIPHTSSEEEERGMRKYETTIGIFYNKEPIAFVGDSFGATELFVAKEHQNKNVGTYLLKYYMEKYPISQNRPIRLGQMTNAGYKTAQRVHKLFVIDALKRGYDVSRKVLEDYPDLINKA